MMSTPLHPRMGLLVAILCWGILQWNLPNLGNNLTPRNLFVGAMMIIMCAVCWTQVIASRHIRWQSPWGSLFIPPLFLLLHAVSMPAGSYAHYPWLAAGVLALMAGLVIGLIQLEWTDDHWCRLSQILMAGTTVLCLFTLASPKYLAWHGLWSALPIPLRAAEGGFQQPNLLASFMATALLFSLWLHAKKATPLPTWQNFVFTVITLIHALVIFKSGSRAGMLGLCLGMVVFCAWVVVYRPPNRATWWWSIFGTLIGVLLATLFGEVIHRLRDLQNGLSTTSRLSFIQVGIHLWGQAPWWGHGIGTFSELFTPTFVQMVQNGEKLDYIHNVGHPHNELLLWAVETGALGVICVFGPWVLFLVRLAWSSGPNRLGWLACWVPIGLHQFTEFPFHSSAAHIWLWAMVMAAGAPAVEPSRLRPSPHRFPPLAGMALMWTLAVTLVIYLSHTGWLSYQAWALRKPIPTNPVDVKTPSQEDPQWTHFLLNRSALDHLHIAQAHYWLSNRAQPGFTEWCSAVSDMGKRKQNPQQWEFEQQCLATLGNLDALHEHHMKLKALGMRP